MQRNVLILARGGSSDGSQTQTLYLAANLPRHGYQPHVVLDGEGTTSDQLRAAGIAVTISPMRGWRSLKGFLLRPLDVGRLRRLVANVRPVLVHASDVYKCRYGLAAARHAQVPVVSHVRGPLSPRDIRKHALDQADALIAIAARHARALQEGGLPQARIHVVDDGVDCDTFSPLRRRDETFRREFSVQKTPTVGLVGRVEEFKKVRDFVHLAGNVLKTGLKVKFFIVGEMQRNEYGASVEGDVRAMGRENDIIFTGRRNDMPAVLAGMDVLVTLSGGSVMFEAQAAGTAVLSISGAGAFSDYTRNGETAICLQTSDMAAAADTLGDLLTDDAKRTALTNRARSDVESHLSVASMVEKTARVYDTLLAAER